jgi:hypothetical protein
MRRFLSCFIAVALNFAVFAAAHAEDDGEWELEQRRSAVFTLSYKQSASIDNQTATSELAFLCNRRNGLGVIGAILVPSDGTFESHQDPISVLILRKSDAYAPSTFFKSRRMGVNFSFRM